MMQNGWHKNAPLGKWSWFGTGGAAKQLFEPAHQADLQTFLRARTADSAPPLHIVGAMSNVIIRDGGLDGVTVRLTHLQHCAWANDGIVVEAGVRTVPLAHHCMRRGRAGLEFLANIPASIGGALRMNAGAYGFSMSDCVKTVIAFDEKGQKHECSAADCGFAYRHCSLPQDWIIVAAILRTSADTPAAIAERMAAMRAQRRRSQPVKARTGGSIFKNAPTTPAWQLIDQAQCRTMTVGDAALAPHHCNFMVNKGRAKASDLEQLGEQVKKAVANHSGISLEWEIRRMGQAS